MRQETRQNFTVDLKRDFAAFEHPKTEKTRQETRQILKAFLNANAAKTRQICGKHKRLKCSNSWSFGKNDLKKTFQI